MKTVFRTSEVIALYGRGAVRHAIASGRWQSPQRGVVVTHSGPLSADEKELVALHTCAPASALAGLSALRHDGFTGFASAHTFVVLPEGADRPDAIELITHWSTHLGTADVHPFREPRRTRPARSLIDAASWCDHDRYARTIILAGMQQGLVGARQMHEALDRRGMCHRRGLIRESILDATGGIQSLPERDFDDIRRGAGLPAPTRQRKVEGPDGRYYLDASWDGIAFTVEVRAWSATPAGAQLGRRPAARQRDSHRRATPADLQLLRHPARAGAGRQPAATHVLLARLARRLTGTSPTDDEGLRQFQLPETLILGPEPLER